MGTRTLIAGWLAVALSVGATAPAAAVVVPQTMPGTPSGVAGTAGKLGARPGANRLPISVSDSVDASVDVGTAT